MTRINIVEPSELYDQHLVAEYRETLMVPAALRRSLRRKTPLDPNKEIPKTFTLNKGHVKFFYDKLLYLKKRYNRLVEEMKARGMSPDPNRTFPDLEEFPEWCRGDWSPSLQELKIIRQRIIERVNEKPTWYRKTEAI